MQQPLLKMTLALWIFALSGCGGGGSDTGTGNGGAGGNTSENQPTPPTNLPIKIKGLVAGSRISSGDQHSALIAMAGQIHSWGNNQHGQRGTGSFLLSDSITPPSVVSISGMPLTELATGSASTLALDNNGSIWSWGLNEHGQLGVDSLTYEFNTPQRIAAMPGRVTRIAARSANGMALNDKGELFAWGWNGWGQIGDGTKSATIGRVGDKLKPALVKTGPLGTASIVDIAQGWATAALLDSAGRIWTWGYNEHGEIGNGTGGRGEYELLPRLADTSALADAHAINIEFGRYHGLALDSTGRLWSWGWNNVGQLGTGKISDSKSIEQVQLPERITTLAAGAQHSLALDTKGTLWAWGQNDFYQLGDGTRIDRRLPVRVDLSALGGREIVALSAGDDFSMVLDDSGRVWGWGNNLRAQVGNTARAYFKSPVFVLEK